jgi:hypothetical protein
MTARRAAAKRKNPEGGLTVGQNARRRSAWGRAPPRVDSAAGRQLLIGFVAGRLLAMVVASAEHSGCPNPPALTPSSPMS